jgi:hypothetical protein
MVMASVRLKMSVQFLVGVLASVFTMAGCAHPAAQNRTNDRQVVDQELSSEMSLKADRDQLQEMRQAIPKEKQNSNDELALYLDLMKQGTEPPQNVRDKFTSLVEKRRTSFRQKVQKLRDNYRRDESKRRDEYLDTLKSKRTEYLAGKHSAEEVRVFLSYQEKERQSFFADERERRTSFESEIMAHSKDFESYMREKLNEFYEQLRIYSKKFSERPKSKKAVTGETGDSKRVNETPASHLGTDD